MISIHNDMTSHGFAGEKAPHTRIPGIWKKLDQLYDLETLDARENEFTFGDSPDPTQRDDDESVPDFELPEDEFGQMMWRSRFRDSESPGHSSPPLVPIEDQKALYMPDMGLLKDLPDGIHSHREESTAQATPPPKKSTRASRSTVKSGKGVKAGAGAAAGGAGAAAGAAVGAAAGAVAGAIEEVGSDAGSVVDEFYDCPV